MAIKERMRKIERNGESELKQKLPTPGGGSDNGIKKDVVVVVLFSKRHGL